MPPVRRANRAFLEFIRGEQAESAANTYTELEIPTYVYQSENYAMLIHVVKLELTRPDITDGTDASFGVHLCDRNQTGLQTIERPGVIARADMSIAAGTAQGTLSEYMAVLGQRENMFYFPEPILYPKPHIFLGLKGTNNGGVKTARVMIGVTYEKVDRQQFVDALVGTIG